MNRTTKNKNLKWFRVSLMRFAFALTLMAMSQHANAQCSNVTYATAANNCSIDYISNVTFVSINRNSTCDPLAVYNTPNPTIMVGQTYSISVTTDGDREGIRAWIDFNGDGVFSNANECVLGPLFANSVPSTYTANVFVPFTATPGVQRLRVRCNYNGATPDASSSQSYGETEDFCVTIIPAVPCTGTPGSNTVLSPTNAICPNSSAFLALGTTYTLSNITYSWTASTTSSLGPWNIAVPNNTMSTLNTPNLTTNTWYQVNIACAGFGSTIQTTAAQVSVSPVIINTIPYYEGFEGITSNNQLPNCSWSSTGGNAQTNIAAAVNGRFARTGSKYASVYGYYTAGTNYYYTNGLQLYAGVTYSASMFYLTEYYGYTNFSELSLKLGTTQAVGTLTNIATVSPVVSPNYKELANTFTVGTSGIYYVAVKVVSQANSYAYYLSWDDLSVTIPCQLNPTSIAITSQSVICAGTSVNLTASGAGVSTFTWNTGATTYSISDTPNNNITYVATGTNSLTNCPATVSKYVVVKPTPVVSIIPTATAVCEGGSVNLQALGANSFTWSNGASGNIISYSPTSNGPINVLGSFSPNDNCTGAATQMITINALPTLNASNLPNNSCLGANVTLSGGGAVHLQWVGSNGSVLFGSPVVVTPAVGTITYSLTGTDENGCSRVSTVTQIVQSCTGINERTGSIEGLSVYPNPSNGDFTIELNNGLTKSIEVIDVTGRVLSTISTTNDKTNVSISNFSNGVYYVKVKTNNSVDVLKIVKQ